MKIPDYGDPNRNVGFSDLVGKTLVKVEGSKGDASIALTTSDGDGYYMWHQQDCCESVRVDDICGEWDEILNTPILKAEENSSEDTAPETHENSSEGSHTWTFYRITTMKGQVVIRWYGTSNGYYSESVSFGKLVK